VVNTFLRLPAVTEQLKVRQVTRGVPELKLTFAQGVSFLRDRVDFSPLLAALPATGAGQDEVLQINSELVMARMFADRRNLFTHGNQSVGDGNEECVIALTSCVTLCESRLVALAVQIERGRFGFSVEPA
jgi:hypothetical protein